MPSGFDTMWNAKAVVCFLAMIGFDTLLSFGNCRSLTDAGCSVRNEGRTMADRPVAGAALFRKADAGRFVMQGEGPFLPG